MSLRATYNGPQGVTFTHEAHIQAPASSSSNPADKQEYLRALRRETTKLQDDVNERLTKFMEQDKAMASASASAAGDKTKPSGASAVDEAKEEENYGEEVAEEN